MYYTAKTLTEIKLRGRAQNHHYNKIGGFKFGGGHTKINLSFFVLCSMHVALLMMYNVMQKLIVCVWPIGQA